MLLIAISRSLAQREVNFELLMDGDASERSLKFAKVFLFVLTSELLGDDFENVSSQPALKRIEDNRIWILIEPFRSQC